MRMTVLSDDLLGVDIQLFAGGSLLPFESGLIRMKLCVGNAKGLNLGGMSNLLRFEPRKLAFNVADICLSGLTLSRLNSGIGDGDGCVISSERRSQCLEVFECLPDVLPWKYSGNCLHPTQKPVESLMPLIESFCPSGGIVLDPFCGSGSTCVAAHRTGRAFVGVELDAKHHRTAVARLNRLVPTARMAA